MLKFGTMKGSDKRLDVHLPAELQEFTPNPLKGAQENS